MNNTQIVNSLNIKEIDPSYFKYFSWTNFQKKFLIACLDFFDNGGGFYNDGYDEDLSTQHYHYNELSKVQNIR